MTSKSDPQPTIAGKRSLSSQRSLHHGCQTSAHLRRSHSISQNVAISHIRQMMKCSTSIPDRTAHRRIMAVRPNHILLNCSVSRRTENHRWMLRSPRLRFTPRPLLRSTRTRPSGSQSGTCLSESGPYPAPPSKIRFNREDRNSSVPSQAAPGLDN